MVVGHYGFPQKSRSGIIKYHNHCLLDLLVYFTHMQLNHKKKKTVLPMIMLKVSLFVHVFFDAQ